MQHLTLSLWPSRRSFITLGLLSGLMLLTRGSHFSGFNALPEASWMIFMVAGCVLPNIGLPWFLTLAVGIDAYAFTFGGVPGTCFSLAYAMLIPAYSAMWLAGRMVNASWDGSAVGYGLFFAAAMGATAVCELISSGSFYLWSGLFNPTWSEFLARESQYAPAVFASSAFWAVAFSITLGLSRLYGMYKTESALTR